MNVTAIMIVLIIFHALVSKVVNIAQSYVTVFLVIGKL